MAMAVPTAVLLLSLAAGVLMALDTDVIYQRETNTSPTAPNITVSLSSVIACAVLCSRVRPWSCGSFTYHGGSCYLYDLGESPVCPGCPVPAPESATASRSASLSFLRQQVTSTCPGKPLAKFQHAFYSIPIKRHLHLAIRRYFIFIFTVVPRRVVAFKPLCVVHRFAGT